MGRVLTLLYHRVRPYEKDVQMLSVTPEHFEQQMRWLKENYHVVRFADEWDSVEGDAVCVTFDDGYRDNFLIAAPILNQLQIPATVFVTTGNMDTGRELWWDELERNLLVDRKYQKTFHLSDEIFECNWDVDTFGQREDLYYSMHWLMKQIGTEKRNDWIRQLQEWNGYTENGREENVCVRSEDLEKIDGSQIEIGVHTVSHPVLSKLAMVEQQKEIQVAKRKLEEILGRRVLTVSYPFGGESDYNKDTVSVCKSLGFSKAAANIPGVWEQGDDLYQIPRQIVRDWDLQQFQEQMKIFWEGK